MWIFSLSTTPGNPGNLLESKNPIGKPVNLLAFIWSWKFLCKMLMIDNHDKTGYQIAYSRN